MVILEESDVVETPEVQIGTFLKKVRKGFNELEARGGINNCPLEAARRFMNTFDEAKSALNEGDFKVLSTLGRLLSLRKELMIQMAKVGSGMDAEKLGHYRTFFSALSGALTKAESEFIEVDTDSPTAP